jgi:hypothetical protein
VNHAWEEYVSFWQRARFVKLTAEELRKSMPHLSNFNFELITSYRIVTLALPPIRLKGSFRVVVLNRTGHEYQLQWISNTDRVTSFAFASDAVTYAEQTWPEQLIEDSWVDVQHIQLCDPTHLDLFKSPSPVMTLYVTLLRSWKEIEGNTSRPLYQSWNNVIQYITTNPIEGEEYAGWQHTVHNRRNCSFCGGGLDTYACSGCSFSYRAIKNGWRVPLAPQLVGLLQSQHHSFGFHPSQLWE